MLRWVVAMLAAGAVYAAAPRVSVHDLVAAVENGLRGGQSDSRVARDIRKLQMSEQLDQHIIEELVSVGAGPKTVEELLRLRDESVGFPLPAAAEFPEPPPPSPADSHKVLIAAAHYAFSYTDSLPDFLCEQTIRRYERLNGEHGWNLKDVLTVKLSYFDEQENYKLTAINGRATVRSYDSVGGALSKGEFGSLLLSIFDPDVGTSFRWDHWTTLRKRKTHVYSFVIERNRSHYHLSSGYGFGEIATTLVGERGFVYIDRDSGRVTRVMDDAVIPEGFPVRQAFRILDYDFTDIGGKPFLVPLHADIRMATDSIHTRNDVEFRDYRKFTGESSITFK